MIGSQPQDGWKGIGRGVREFNERGNNGAGFRTDVLGRTLMEREGGPNQFNIKSSISSSYCVVGNIFEDLFTGTRQPNTNNGSILCPARDFQCTDEGKKIVIGKYS